MVYIFALSDWCLMLQKHFVGQGLIKMFHGVSPTLELYEILKAYVTYS